jgi:hypothetical protein
VHAVARRLRIKMHQNARRARVCTAVIIDDHGRAHRCTGCTRPCASMHNVHTSMSELHFGVQIDDFSCAHPCASMTSIHARQNHALSRHQEQKMHQNAQKYSLCIDAFLVHNFMKSIVILCTSPARRAHIDVRPCTDVHRLHF